MTTRERLWRCIREATASYEAPDHLSDTKLRGIAVAMTGGVAPYSEDQPALGPLPKWAEDEL